MGSVNGNIANHTIGIPIFVRRHRELLSTQGQNNNAIEKWQIGSSCSSSWCWEHTIPKDFRRKISGTKTEEKWIQLFNGRNWKAGRQNSYHEAGVNHANTFRVEDGILKVGYDGYSEFNETFGHLFYKETFSHYRLRVEYRFVGNQVKGGPGWAIRNSGLMLHGKRPKRWAKTKTSRRRSNTSFWGGMEKMPERPQTSAHPTPYRHE